MHEQAFATFFTPVTLTLTGWPSLYELDPYPRTWRYRILRK